MLNASELDDTGLKQDPANGRIVFETYVKKSSGGYRYRTIGFYVHMEPSNGNPDWLYNQGLAGKIEIKDWNAWCEDTYPSGNLVHLVCRIPDEVVSNAFMEAGFDPTPYGDGQLNMKSESTVVKR
jgi:hypothetical protein